MTADMILKDGLFTTLDRSNPSATAVVITNSVFSSVGREQDVMQHAGPSTRVIELGGHRARQAIAPAITAWNVMAFSRGL
jgi:predicted amidohydrolase YtcJ